MGTVGAIGARPRRLLREGPLALMTSFGAVRRARSVPWWVLALGLAVLGASVWTLWLFSRGGASMDAGTTALTTALLGYLGVAVWLVPRLAPPAARLVGRIDPAAGRLLSTDVRRYAVSLATTAGILAVGASLALGSQTMQHLASAQVAEQKAERLPTTLVVTGQELLDQCEALDLRRGGRAGALGWGHGRGHRAATRHPALGDRAAARAGTRFRTLGAGLPVRRALPRSGRAVRRSGPRGGGTERDRRRTLRRGRGRDRDPADRHRGAGLPRRRSAASADHRRHHPRRHRRRREPGGAARVGGRAGPDDPALPVRRRCRRATGAGRRRRRRAERLRRRSMVPGRRVRRDPLLRAVHRHRLRHDGHRRARGADHVPARTDAAPPRAGRAPGDRRDQPAGALRGRRHRGARRDRPRHRRRARARRLAIAGLARLLRGHRRLGVAWAAIAVVALVVAVQVALASASPAVYVGRLEPLAVLREERR